MKVPILLYHQCGAHALSRLSCPRHAIGSGIAEAACKTIVSTRAKRCGMRWTPEGIDALLPLRTVVLNGTYDSFWEEYAA